MERKNMFSINLDDDSVIDSEELILRRESAELFQKREALSDQLSDALKKNLKKSLYRILPPYIMAGIGVLLGSTAFEIAESEEKFPIALGIIAGLLLVVGIAWIMIAAKKAKAGDEEPDENLECLDKEYDAFNAQVKQELQIPAQAADVEVFVTMHSAARDKKATFAYTNDTPSAFVEDGKLCFWYGEAVVGFSMSEIESLAKVNKPITFDTWLADDPHDSLKYVRYDIEKKETNHEEQYTMTGYYSLRFNHECEPFELLFPLFGAETLLKLINREITEE